MFDDSVINALAQPRPDDTKQWLFSALLFGSRPVGADFVGAPPSVESFPPTNTVLRIEKLLD